MMNGLFIQRRNDIEENSGYLVFLILLKAVKTQY